MAGTAMNGADLAKADHVEGLLYHRGSRSHSGTKRAYRSRRKDPSCDACRDRKVKCNASENSSCSECIGRRVPCKFTKDTNRRMSSLKQIQDLQAQLATAKQELAGLLSPGKQQQQQLPQQTPPRTTEKHAEAQCSPDLVCVAQTQDSLQTNHHEIPWASPISGIATRRLDHRLPGQTEALAAVDGYMDSINQWLPLFDRETFKNTVSRLYAAPVSTWSVHHSMLLAVVAFGASVLDPVGLSGLVDHCLLLAQADLDHHFRGEPIEAIKVAAVISAVYREQLQHLQSSKWLAVAIRLAQDAGLHLEETTDRHICRIWPCLYTLDRLLSFENDLPCFINTADCDPQVLTIHHPASTDEVHSCPMIAMAQTIELAGKVMRTGPVTHARLACMDEEFKMITQRCNSIPTIDASDSVCLCPQLLWIIRSCRLSLYRRSLSIASTRSQRLAALSCCVAIAEETANCLFRDPEKRLPHVHGRHIWRCVSVLLLAGKMAACSEVWRFMMDAKTPLELGHENVWSFAEKLLSQSQAGIDPLDDGDVLSCIAFSRRSRHQVCVWKDENCVVDRGSSNIIVTENTVQDLLRQLEDAGAQARSHPTALKTQPQVPSTSAARSQSNKIITPLEVVNRISIADLV